MMALRALVRRGVSYSSYSASTLLAGNSRSSVTTPLGDKLTILAKAFSTKPAGNEFVGMDYGSTNSGVSVMDGKSLKGTENVDTTQLTPSVVAFNQKGQILFGTPAMQAMSNPTNTVFGTKNFITRCFHASAQRQAAKEAGEIAGPGMNHETFRPLSPHLAVYAPQLSSTISISHRITYCLLYGLGLSWYLLTIKAGVIGLTYSSFYPVMYYASKLSLVSAELAALAVAYQVWHEIRHLYQIHTYAEGGLFGGKLRK